LGVLSTTVRGRREEYMGMVTGYLAAIRLYVLLERNFEAAIQTAVARVGLRKYGWTSKEFEKKER
jgi:hypothetical protein